MLKLSHIKCMELKLMNIMSKLTIFGEVHLPVKYQQGPSPN